MRRPCFLWSTFVLCLVLTLGGTPSLLSIETVSFDAVTGTTQLRLRNVTPGIVWFTSHSLRPTPGYQTKEGADWESLIFYGCGNGLLQIPLLPLQSVTYTQWLPRGMSRPVVRISSATQSNVDVVGDELVIGRYFYPGDDFEKMLFREKHAKAVNEAVAAIRSAKGL